VQGICRKRGVQEQRKQYRLVSQLKTAVSKDQNNGRSRKEPKIFNADVKVRDEVATEHVLPGCGIVSSPHAYGNIWCMRQGAIMAVAIDGLFEF
jgi:hypothetical protein